MKLFTTVLLLCSHLPFIWHCLNALLRRELPRSVDLIGVSFFIYFDLEIGFESFGGSYNNGFFKPFFSADDGVLAIAIIAILLGPWIAKAGYLLASRRAAHIRYPRIHLSSPKAFYTATTILSCLLSGFSIWRVASAPAVWSARAELGSVLGPFVILLYAPLGFLGFYLRQVESRTRSGKIFTLALVLLSMASTLCIGERTLILLPLLLVALFYGRVSVYRIAVAALMLITLAAALLPFFKIGFMDRDNTDLASSVFSGDIARGPVLVASIENSCGIGTRILPYPGFGYVYSALLYVPRAVAPFKGTSTATQFTAKMDSSKVEETTWNLGIGAIDELVLNFGWLLALPGVFTYGACFAMLDRISMSCPALKVAVLLSAVWLMGYNLPALLNTFGAIALFGGACQLAFTERRLLVPITFQRASARQFSASLQSP